MYGREDTYLVSVEFPWTSWLVDAATLGNLDPVEGHSVKHLGSSSRGQHEFGLRRHIRAAIRDNSETRTTTYSSAVAPRCGWKGAIRMHATPSQSLGDGSRSKPACYQWCSRCESERWHSACVCDGWRERSAHSCVLAEVVVSNSPRLHSLDTK